MPHQLPHLDDRDKKTFADKVIKDDMLLLALQWVVEWLDAECVFGHEHMDKWARDNGYVRKG